MDTIRIGMIGAGFMCKLHSIALKNYPMYFFPPEANVALQCIADSNVRLAEEGMARYGYKEYEEDWTKLIGRGDVDAIDIVTPNWVHREMALEALKSGKPVFCEKPLSNTLEGAREVYEAARSARVVNAVGYNNRCIPAVTLAKQMIESGQLGEIYTFRTQYMQDWAIGEDVPMEWRLDIDKAGSGALGDICSHAIDLARYLVGNFAKVAAKSRTIIKKRPVSESAVLGLKKKREVLGYQEVKVDDEVEFLVEFTNGATGIFTSSRFAYGHKNTLDFEVYGSRGALKFTNEYLWELQYYSGTDPEDRQGYKKIKMGPMHPYGMSFWPIADLGIGYADLKCAEMSHFIEAVSKKDPFLVSASFYDGYKACQIIDAVQRSAREEKWVGITDD